METESNYYGKKISTPCRKLCRIEENVCTGCGRSLEQIKNWITYSEKERKEIMGELAGDRTRNNNSKTS